MAMLVRAHGGRRSERRRRRRADLLAVAVWLLAARAVAQPCAYVAEYGGDSVAVIDTGTRSIVNRIPVGDGPVNLAARPGGRAVYVSNYLSNTVSVIDTTAGRVVATVPVGTGPAGVAVTPNGSFAYVANHLDDSVSVIDTASNDVDEIIDVPPEECAPAERCGLNGVAVNAAGTRAYVVGGHHGPGLNFRVSVIVINTATNTIAPQIVDFGQVGFFGGTPPPGPFPGAVTVVPGSGVLYVTDWLRLKLRVFNSSASTQLAERDFLAFDVDAAPDGRSVYGTHSDCMRDGNLLRCSGAVAVFDTTSHDMVGDIRTSDCEPFDPDTCFPGLCPQADRCLATGVAATADGQFLYAADLHSNSVSLLDVRQRLRLVTLPLQGDPLGIAIAAVPGGCVAAPTHTPSRTPTPVATATRTRTATATPTRAAGTMTVTPEVSGCPGDCDGDGLVHIGELVRGIRHLRGDGADGCAIFDRDANGLVSVDEIVAAIVSALYGCDATAVEGRGSLIPCRSSQDWVFDTNTGGEVVVVADTIDAATAADLCVDVTCAGGLSFSGDDQIECTFPPPSFDCPRAARVFAEAGDCTVRVRTCSDSCADPARADYVLRVTLDGAPVAVRRAL